MILTNEQLEQCRREFEEKFPLNGGEYWSEENQHYRFNGGLMGDIIARQRNWNYSIWFKAWRPVPTVGEIEAIINGNNLPFPNGRVLTGDDIKITAQAIHHAFGGKE